MAFDVSKIHLLRKPENVHNHKGKDKTKFPRQTIKNFFAEKHNIIITTPGVKEIISVLDKFLSEVAEKSVLRVKERGKVYVTDGDVKHVIGLRKSTAKAKVKYEMKKLKKQDEKQQAVEKSETGAVSKENPTSPLFQNASAQTQELPVVPIITEENKAKPDIETFEIPQPE